MSETLFRKEAIEAKSNRFESSSKMVSSVGFLTYLLFIASVAIAVAKVLTSPRRSRDPCD